MVYDEKLRVVRSSPYNPETLVTMIYKKANPASWTLP